MRAIALRGIAPEPPRPEPETTPAPFALAPFWPASMQPLADAIAGIAGLDQAMAGLIAAFGRPVPPAAPDVAVVPPTYPQVHGPYDAAFWGEGEGKETEDDAD